MREAFKVLLFALLTLPAAAQQINAGTQLQGQVRPVNGGLGLDSSSATGCAKWVSGVITVNSGNCTASVSGVSSLNSLTGPLTLAAGANVTITPSGSTITIAATSGSGSGNINPPTGPYQVPGSGSSGTTWGPQPSIWLQNGYLWNWFQPAQSTVLSDGGGYNESQSNSYTDAVNFTTSVGNYAGNTGSEWYQSQGKQEAFNFLSNGIKQPHLMNLTVGAAGDLTIDRRFANIVNGGCVSSSDECQKNDYLYFASLNTYKGTVMSGVSGTGATQFRMTSLGNSCGGGQNGYPLCMGSGLMMLRTNAPVYTGLVVSAMTQPTQSAPGVMTLASGSTVTPSVAVATISVNMPSPPNRQTGETVSGITPTVVSGTIPTSTAVGNIATQQACLFSGLGNTAESHYYLWSGSGTLTLLNHREPSTTNGVQILYFGGPCMSAVDQADFTAMGGNSFNLWYLGATDSTHIAYTSYIRGLADNPMYHTGFAFSPNTAGKDTINVYNSVKILGVADPTFTPNAFNASPSSGGQPVQYAVTTENSIPWAAGDTIEAAMEPASQLRGHDEYYNFMLPSAVSTNVPYHTELNGRVDGLREMVWNSNSTFLWSYAGSGAIYNLMQGTFAPTNSSFEFSGCPTGGTGNCSNSAAAWMFHVAPAGLGWKFNYPMNRNDIYGATNFLNPVSAAAGSKFGGLDPGVPEGTLSYLTTNFPPGYNAYYLSQLVRQTDAVAGSECTSGTGTDTGYHVLCENNVSTAAYQPVGVTRATLNAAFTNTYAMPYGTSPGSLPAASSSYISAFLGGTWINMSNGGPSGIGDSGAGQNPWIARAGNTGQYFPNAQTGDIVFLSLTHRLLFGTGGTANATFMLSGNNAYFGTGQQTQVSSIGILTTQESTVASAATIAPTTTLFHLTGTTSVSVMTPPLGFATTTGAGLQGGSITFIADAATSIAAGTSFGSFKTAFTTVAGTPYTCWFTPSVGLWFCK